MNKNTPKKQKMRYSDAEMAQIKATFAENDDLLYALRKVFLQEKLEPTDISALNTQIKAKPEALHVVRKSYLPSLEMDAPIGQPIDLWMTIDGLKDKTPNEAAPFIEARHILISYLEQQIKAIENSDYDFELAAIRFKDLLPQDDRDHYANYVKLTVRNLILSHGEQQIHQLSVLAGQKAETVEQTMERLAKDSSK